jgi:tRNA(Ile)-lysidine synthase
MGLVEKVKNSGLINYNDKIVVGVSGGPDSMCLLNILLTLSKEFDLIIFVVHINHCLREEADFEENYVRNFCDKSNIKFFSKKTDISTLAKQNKVSTEEIAREVRYNFFYEILKQTGSNKIAVAHNANDNAETILMNILRGCGPDGLTGISEINQNIIRPLIDIKRSEIEEYCSENMIQTMIDKTNLESVYMRNKIRNNIIPYLQEFNPDIIAGLNKMGNIIQEEEEFIEEYIDEEYKEIKIDDKEKVILDKEKFIHLKTGLQRRILRKAVFEFCGSLKNISFNAIDNAILIIKDSHNGNIVKITNKVKILINYNKLEFFDEKEEKKDFIYELNIPGMTYIHELDSYVSVEIADADKVPDIIKEKNKKIFDIAKTGKKLYLRNRKNGDYFYPTGMTGTKKIKDFFSDNKIELYERDRIPILTNENDIIWVVGMRSSKKFLKDKSTKEVIIINYGENI